MREIVCRNCGAQNPAQSKFCNKCGETLSSDTSQLCPNCEALNPLDLMYCDNCGTRLADDHLDEDANSTNDEASGKGAQPFSLPSRPPGHTGNLDVSGEIPAWLKTGEMEEFEESDEQDPDWLQGAEPPVPEDPGDALTLAELGGEHEPSDDLPTWLLEDDSADEIFYSEKSTDELFSGSQSGEPDDGDGDGDDSDVDDEAADWLQGLNAPDTDSLPLTEAEDAEWPGRDEEEADEALTSAELESWLKAIEDEDSPEVSSLPEAEEFPDWLSGEQEQPQAEGSAPQLDWDADASEGDPEAEAGSDPPDVSSWMQDIDDEEPAPFSGATEAPESQAEDEEIPEEDFMAWLATLDDGEPEVVAAPERDDDSGLEFSFGAEDDAESSPQAEDEEAGDETPAWLNELTEAMDEQVEAEPTPAEELPEWLQTLSVEGDEQAASALFADDEPEAEVPQVEDDEEMELPNWLAGVATELDTTSSEDLIEELPGTFDDEIESDAAEEVVVGANGVEANGASEQAPAEAEESFDFLAAGDESDEAQELVASEDLPDWFSDVLADIEGEDEAFDLDTTLDSSQVPEELANVPPQLASNDLPEWLDSPFNDLPEAEPTPLDEIPEWLLPMAPTEASMEQESDEELNLGEMGEIESSSEWSDLLQALPPPERESETLSEAEIPEWLQVLKPRSLREEGEEEEVPLPEESEGPLAGLRGVLAISPVVSRPRAAERSDPELAVPEQQQQVTLLRQLAREESQATITIDARDSAPRSGLATRLLLALLLLVTVIAGLLLPQLVSGLEPVTPVNLEASQTVLEQAAGQPVIVAFDYTPALNGVLQPQANAVLQALSANNSQAILLSQSAAGATLAQQAAANVDGLQSVTIGYVPGDSLGLRNLSNCIEADQVCQSVSGRPVEQATAETLQNAALIIVLTGDQENLLDWIEQVESATSLPLMAVVTPAIAPLAAPYHETGQLSALLSGQPTLGADEPLVPEAQALALGHWLAAALLLLGALFYLVRGAQRGRQ